MIAALLRDDGGCWNWMGDGWRLATAVRMPGRWQVSITFGAEFGWCEAGLMGWHEFKTMRECKRFVHETWARYLVEKGTV